MQIVSVKRIEDGNQVNVTFVLRKSDSGEIVSPRRAVLVYGQLSKAELTQHVAYRAVSPVYVTADSGVEPNTAMSSLGLVILCTGVLLLFTLIAVPICYFSAAKGRGSSPQLSRGSSESGGSAKSTSRLAKSRRSSVAPLQPAEHNAVSWLQHDAAQQHSHLSDLPPLHPPRPDLDSLPTSSDSYQANSSVGDLFDYVSYPVSPRKLALPQRQKRAAPALPVIDEPPSPTFSTPSTPHDDWRRLDNSPRTPAHLRHTASSLLDSAFPLTNSANSDRPPPPLPLRRMY